jgi:hypothetical protein
MIHIIVSPPAHLSIHYSHISLLSIPRELPQYRDHAWRMPRFQKNRAERYEELVRELQSVLDNVSKARDLLRDEDLLKSDARRWIHVLNILVDAIYQKGDLPENDDDDTESESVHMVLSKGVDDTVESIRGVLTCAPSLQTAATLQRLRRRVALHTESTSLITGLLDR